MKCLYDISDSNVALKRIFSQTTWSNRPKQSNVAAQKCLFTQKMILKNLLFFVCQCSLLLTMNQQLTSLSVSDLLIWRNLFTVCSFMWPHFVNKWASEPFLSRNTKLSALFIFSNDSSFGRLARLSFGI